MLLTHNGIRPKLDFALKLATQKGTNHFLHHRILWYEHRNSKFAAQISLPFNLMRAPKFEICRSNLSPKLHLFLLRNDSYLNEQPGTAFENIQRFLHHRPDFMNPTLMTIFLKRGVTTTPPSFSKPTLSKSMA